MTMKRYSRRQIARQVGMMAGIGLVLPRFAAASIVTPKQVEGPFYPIGQKADDDMDLTKIAGGTETATGETILVRGQVFDTKGQPLTNASVDVWQANHHGRYSHPKDPNPAPLDPNFEGWGVMRTDATGSYSFKTIKPGAYPLKFIGEEGWRCRHIHFKVSRPGYAPITTQMYFDGDPLIATDLEIAKAPKEHQQLLIVKEATDSESGLPLFNFNLTLATGV